MQGHSYHVALRSYLMLAFFVISIFSFSAEVFAAETLITPATGTYTKGQTFTATVRVDPQGKSINAVQATLTFDSSKFSVVSISKTGSIFSLWTTEPTFSNTQGTIDFGGGTTKPFLTQSTLVVITFRATGEGDGDVAFKTALVTAADGLGTDVYSGSQKATYTVSADTAPTPKPKPDTPTDQPTQDLNTGDQPKDKPSDATIAFGDPPRAPEVKSKIFADAEVWYATTTGSFTWDLPFDVNGLFLEIATTSNNIPTKKVTPPVGEVQLTPDMLHDGVQYLSMQFSNQVGLGAILNRKIKVDITPPSPFTINVRAGNSTSSFPTLHFEANDPTSGIDHYELTLASREAVTVTPDEARLGYLITNLEDGTYTVKVKAFDKAGNVTESSTPILITAGWTKPTDLAKGSSFWSIFSLSNLFLVLLFILLGVLIGYIVYLRKQFGRKESRLRKESKEIQDQMEKIFSALRDEIYDQINAITKKPRLSRQEKEAVENLSSALEVSETLIEKEIIDVQKILR